MVYSKSVQIYAPLYKKELRFLNYPSIRIIGGTLRGRRVQFPAIPGLRPTPNRIRETVFNWLTPYIHRATCLDLFAGSGALSFEAVSRGASSVLAIEKNSKAITMLQQHKLQFKLNNLEFLKIDAQVYLQSEAKPFDIIFVDPPYSSHLLLNCLSDLHQKQWVQSGTLVYFECDTPIDNDQLPVSWILLKAKKAGNVYFYLAKT